MTDALTPGANSENYYRYRLEQEDGGYLQDLVVTCQTFLSSLSQFAIIQPALLELAGYYCDLQVHKHVNDEERVPRLQQWFQEHRARLPEMSWYEFSACSGSTLGIFCIVSYTTLSRPVEQLVNRLKEGFFPWIQGLHILLDYFIDQQEDKLGGDLNFCFYYDSSEVMLKRLEHFVKQSNVSITHFPDSKFHRMINQGLLGLYLADKKVSEQRQVRQMARKMIRKAGGNAWFFFANCWLYRRLKPNV